jgi:hypothetical protein
MRLGQKFVTATNALGGGNFFYSKGPRTKSTDFVLNSKLISLKYTSSYRDYVDWSKVSLPGTQLQSSVSPNHLQSRNIKLPPYASLFSENNASLLQSNGLEVQLSVLKSTQSKCRENKRHGANPMKLFWHKFAHTAVVS